jgi:hypothetical protein
MLARLTAILTNSLGACLAAFPGSDRGRRVWHIGVDRVRLVQDLLCRCTLSLGRSLLLPCCDLATGGACELLFGLSPQLCRLVTLSGPPAPGCADHQEQQGGGFARWRARIRARQPRWV